MKCLGAWMNLIVKAAKILNFLRENFHLNSVA